jgi:hypothetical protein
LTNEHKLVVRLDSLLILEERGGARAGVGVSVLVGAAGFVGGVGDFGAIVRVTIQGRKVVSWVLW